MSKCSAYHAVARKAAACQRGAASNSQEAAGHEARIKDMDSEITALLGKAIEISADLAKWEDQIESYQTALVAAYNAAVAAVEDFLSAIGKASTEMNGASTGAAQISKDMGFVLEEADTINDQAVDAACACEARLKNPQAPPPAHTPQQLEDKVRLLKKRIEASDSHLDGAKAFRGRIEAAVDEAEEAGEASKEAYEEFLDLALIKL